MHFGFSYTGLIMLLMLFIPNFLWTKRQPEGYAEYAARENKILLAFERVGQFIVTPCALMFSDFNPKGWNWWCWVLVLAFLNLVVYDIAWVRYFKSPHNMQDFYRSFLGMPLALATYPVIAFYLLGVFGGNILMIFGAVILGIGHIGIHTQHAREVFGPRKKKHIALRILKWICIAVIVILLATLNTAIAGRSFKQIKRMIDYRNGVDENIYVELNGRQQYMWIAGRDTSNPVIISLHGGPGGPTTFCDYDYINYLTDEYTVVIWEETGCGRSYYANADVTPNNDGLTFGSQMDDLDALVDYLCDRFGQDQVIIMGHSYGTLLGSEYIAVHPEKVSAYIGIGQVIEPFNDETTYSYERALEIATQAGEDTSALENAYADFIRNPDKIDTTAMMALRTAWSPYLVQTNNTDTSVWDAMTCPTLSVEDIEWYLVMARSVTGDDTFNRLEGVFEDKLLEYDLNSMGDIFTMPTLFISGSCDWVCPAELAQGYALINGLDYAPIEGCGHSPQGQVPEQVAEVIREFLHGI